MMLSSLISMMHQFYIELCKPLMNHRCYINVSFMFQMFFHIEANYVPSTKYQWFIDETSITLAERGWKFCEILYVNKHFLNDFRWFVLNIPCRNFVCCCDIFQVSSKNPIKVGWVLNVTFKYRQTKNKNFQPLRRSWIKFTCDRLAYNLTVNYKRKNTD